MSLRHGLLRRDGAPTGTAAAPSVLLLLLLLACAAVCPLCVRAAETSSYTEAEQTNTLAFLKGFVTPASTLTDVWTGTDFCTWTYVTCEESSLTLDLQALQPTAPLALPELADGVDGATVLVSRIHMGGLGSSVSGTLPASWGRLARLVEVALAGNALTGPLPAEWSGMAALQRLLVNSNQLSGSIPPSLGALPLTTVDISGNEFCGCVPGQWRRTSSLSLTADPAVVAADCATANMCAVGESSAPALRATLAFLQGFAASMPSLQSTWTGTRYCTWPGVTCFRVNVVAVDLSAVTLTSTGSLPELSESVDGSLVVVTSVDVSGKAAMVSGSLPASWGRLTRLVDVVLPGNALTGPLPDEWSSLMTLYTLDLSGNQLSGTLPAAWSSMWVLQELVLSNNRLNGVLPATWGSMASLKKISLSGNDLAGPLPDAWSGLSGLSVLQLNNNRLSGSIPPSLGALPLTTVDISGNEFCGCVPSAWSTRSSVALTADPAMVAADCAKTNACAVDESSSPAARATLAFLQGFAASMPSLQSTWTGTRYCTWPGVVCGADGTVTLDFSDVSLAAAGSLPELSESVDGSLVAVTSVHIGGKAAMVGGSLPASWGRLTRLVEVVLPGNALAGPLPAAWGSLAGVSTVEVSNNRLSGTLPATWESMKALNVLSLSTNALTGPLPAEWSGMAALQRLLVSSNQLSGSIPPSLGALPLTTVDISGNKFCGCVPSAWSTSSSVTLTADPAMVAADCATINSCSPESTTTAPPVIPTAKPTSASASSSSSSASSSSSECEVTGCTRCEAGAARECARCQPGYVLTTAKTCVLDGSGTAAAAAAAVWTGAALVCSLAMTL